MENQHYILNIDDIFTKFTGHPRNWMNMIFSKEQVYGEKTIDFLSKKEGPVYFEQACKTLRTWETRDIIRDITLIVFDSHRSWQELCSLSYKAAWSMSLSLDRSTCWKGKTPKTWRSTQFSLFNLYIWAQPFCYTVWPKILLFLSCWDLELV